MQDQPINDIYNNKHLGIILSNDLRWSAHLDYTKTKAWKRINVMKKLKFSLDRKSLETIYLSFIRPILAYDDVLFDNCTKLEKKNE
jgi:hypothetical protein